MSEFILQQVVNWLTLGSIYALVAIGFSLLFGVLNIIHFSHGDVSLVSPFVAMGILQAVLVAAGGMAVTGALFTAALVAVLAVGLLGVLLDKLIVRRFRDSPAMMALVATVALGIVIREVIRHVYPQGSNPHAFPRLVEGRAFELAGVSVSWFVVFVIAVTIGLMTLLWFILKHTPLGLRIRAASEDRVVARLMGISHDRVFRATFFIASAIGGVAGLLFASYAGVMRFDFGIFAGLLGFSAAVIGGLGSMPGAILGGLIIAGLETLVQAVIPGGAAYRLVFVFLLVVVVLVFRPVGLLGRTEIEKV